MVVSHSIVMPTVEYAFAPRHLTLYAYKTPSRHVLKHTITTAFLLKNGTLIKACHRASFSGNGHNGFFKKSYHKKAPHRPTKNDNQIKASAFKKLYVYKALSWLVFQTARVQRVRAETSRRSSLSAGAENFPPRTSSRMEEYVSTLRYDKRV